MKKLAAILLILTLAALPFDHPLAAFLHPPLPGLHVFFSCISRYLGESQFILIPAAAVLFYSWKQPAREKPFIISLHVFSLVAITGILVQLPKYLLGRARPNAFWREGIDGLHFLSTDSALTSFPSGHTATAAALAFALSTFFPKWKIPLGIYVALVAVSRMVLEKHYLSDVLGGALAACLVAFALAKRLPMRV